MPKFDRKRFEALVLYIAWRARDDPKFGRIKLAKALFYSDFDVYLDAGSPLTGATYIRLPQGPFPRQLDDAEQSLSQSGLVRLEHDAEEFAEKRIIPLGQPPDLGDMFEPWQLLVVDGWIAAISRNTARVTSDVSHKHPGWRLAGKTGIEIPYETAFLPQGPPSAQDAERAVALGRKEGWLNDDGWVWEREAAESQ